MKLKLRALMLVGFCFLLFFVPIQFSAGQTSGTTVGPEIVTYSGNTLVVNVTIKNVENLYGVDVTISWNSSTMQLVEASDWLGVENYPSGVLHVTPSYPIEVAVNDTSQETGVHHVAATSQGDAEPFYGDGTLVTLTFTVTGSQIDVSVTSELADHPEPGDATSEPIPHTDFTLTMPANPSQNPTISANPTPTATPTSTPIGPTPTPEFPQAAIVVLALIAVSAVLVLVVARRKR